jgi:hypothetical protein
MILNEDCWDFDDKYLLILINKDLFLQKLVQNDIDLQELTLFIDCQIFLSSEYGSLLKIDIKVISLILCKSLDGDLRVFSFDGFKSY